jgi:tetratricopeptide (TPR) repeat protein
MDRYDEARDAALETIEHWNQLGPQSEFYDVLREEIYHWLGRAYYHTGFFEEAMDAFVTSYEAGLDLPALKDREFHTHSAYFAGRTNELLSNPSQAREYYRAALDQRAGESAIERAKQRLDRLR